MSLGLRSPSSNDSGLPSNDGDLSEIAVDDLDISEVELGQGAFGCVFRAHYFGTEVAIKKMKIPSDSDLKKFMKREVIILKSMRHPHIVQFVGVSKTADSLLIITEYAKGGDLHQSLKSNGNLYGMWKSKVTLSQQVASAMSYLHSKKIVFRDLKAKNILVNDKAHPTIAKICDFGFARVLDKSISKSNYLTICGTDDWMAPEVIMGMDYDDKSDVFSFGVVLLELIIGTKTVKNELKRHPHQSFELDMDKVRALAPKSCPPQYLDLAIFCCAYEPKDRPDFKSIVMAFSKILQDPKTVDMSAEEIIQCKQLDDLTRASLKVEPEPEPVLESYNYNDYYDDGSSQSAVGSQYELNDLYSKVKGVSFGSPSSYRSTRSTGSVGDLSAESQFSTVGDADASRIASSVIATPSKVEATTTTSTTTTTTTPAKGEASSNNLNNDTNTTTTTPVKGEASSNSLNNTNNTTPVKETSSNSINNTTTTPTTPTTATTTDDKPAASPKSGIATFTEPIITIFNHIFTVKNPPK